VTRSESRTANVATTEGAYIGACIYLTAEDLQLLGIDLAELSPEKIEYSVDSEQEMLIVRPEIRD